MRRIVVTSALPYANGSIHLGHLVEYIQTDIWVRSQKMAKNECVYICADDSHGTPIMLKAKELGITPEELIKTTYDEHVKDFKDFQRPEPSIPKSIGHHQEWIQSIKTGSKTTCNFDYSGPLTEVVLLGNIAHRTNSPIFWDHEQMIATGHSQADEFINHEYRKGWEL